MNELVGTWNSYIQLSHLLQSPHNCLIEIHQKKLPSTLKNVKALLMNRKTLPHLYSPRFRIGNEYKHANQITDAKRHANVCVFTFRMWILSSPFCCPQLAKWFQWPCPSPFIIIPTKVRDSQLRNASTMTPLKIGQKALWYEMHPHSNTHKY